MKALTIFKVELPTVVFILSTANMLKFKIYKNAEHSIFFGFNEVYWKFIKFCLSTVKVIGIHWFAIIDRL